MTYVREREPSLVHAFRQSTPYVNVHRGATFVLMIGGEAICHPNFANIVSDIALLQTLGIRLVLVFGSRPQNDEALARAGIQAQYHKRVRVTDDESFAIIKQVCGGLQYDITAQLSMGLANTPMQGARISVVSGNFVTAQPQASIFATAAECGASTWKGSPASWISMASCSSPPSAARSPARAST